MRKDALAGLARKTKKGKISPQPRSGKPIDKDGFHVIYYITKVLAFEIRYKFATLCRFGCVLNT